MRILFLTADELTRDPRIRRAVAHAADERHTCVGACPSSATAIALPGVEVRRWGRHAGRREHHRRPMHHRPLVRELRGGARLTRWIYRTTKLARTASSLGRVDIVHASDLETLPAGYVVARRHSARLVYDSHEIALDQEPDTPRLYRWLASRIEARLARRADAVVTVSDSIAELLASTLRLRRRPYVVLNAPATVAAPRRPRPRQARSAALRAVYQGGPGPGRRLTDLLDAGEKLEGDVEILVRVVGANTEQLRSAVAGRRLAHRVSILEPVRPDRLVEALVEFDVGLIINRPVSRNDELVFPNKLFEYMMAGLAVVAPRLPGLCPLVEREGIGVLYEPGSPEGLAQALDALARDRHALEEMRSRARTAAVTRYNAEAQRPALYAAWGL